MHDTPSLVLAIVGSLLTYTMTVIAAVIWLTGKLRHLEKTFYRELDHRRGINDKRFEGHGTRIQRLEIRAFGFAQPRIAEPTDGIVEG